MTATEPVNQFKYQPLHKPNQLIYGIGQISVSTGWTVKQAILKRQATFGGIAKQLQPHEYAVIGQLYSATWGISLLMRNWLANPHVYFLVVLNATKEDRNAGGCECLLDFFRNGFIEGFSDTGRRCWVICSNIQGFIDIEIEAKNLEKLRQSVEWQESFSIADAVSQVKAYTLRSAVEPWGSPIVEIPFSTAVPTVLPGPRYWHRIEGNLWITRCKQRIYTTFTHFFPQRNYFNSRSHFLMIFYKPRHSLIFILSKNTYHQQYLWNEQIG